MKLPDEVKTNTDFVNYIMNYSQQGAMSQMFVIEAIRFYSKLIVDNGEPQDNVLSLLSPVAWYKTAKEINSYWEQKYGQPNSNSSDLPR